MLVERFKIMWPDGEGSDLQKIMTTQELVDVVSWLETLRKFDGAPKK